MSPRRGGLTARDPLDWQAERDRIDLADVVRRELGEPARNGRWPCPIHGGEHPNFAVRGDGWRCWSCGESGDAVDLVRALRGLTFPEAVAYLTGRPDPSERRPRPRPRPAPKPRPESRPEAPQPPEPEGMTAADALALVESAAARLWSTEGSDALDYLTGRGLTPETIRTARLGWTPRAVAFPWKPPGIVIPWFATGDSVALVKIRPDDTWRDALPEGRRPPKYLTPRGWPIPPTLYPSPETIRPGCPAVIVEGEFDALLLGQALGDRAAVVTIGSASGGRAKGGIARPIRDALRPAPAWLIATDADEAGDQAAAAWNDYGRARRVRPPIGKDWTEAGTDLPGTTGTAVNLSRWWGEILDGHDAPPPFSWSNLASWRWGPALDDPESDTPNLVAPETADR